MILSFSFCFSSFWYWCISFSLKPKPYFCIRGPITVATSSFTSFGLGSEMRQKQFWVIHSKWDIGEHNPSKTCFYLSLSAVCWLVGIGPLSYNVCQVFLPQPWTPGPPDWELSALSGWEGIPTKSGLKQQVRFPCLPFSCCSQSFLVALCWNFSGLVSVLVSPSPRTCKLYNT